MLTIRLQRAGKKNRPEYRLILAEKTAAATKKFVEVLGNYNPHSKDLVIRNQDRLNYWIDQRVELSPTVHNLFVTKSIISEPKTKAFSIPKKPVEAVAEASTETAAPAPEETSADASTESPAEQSQS